MLKLLIRRLINRFGYDIGPIAKKPRAVVDNKADYVRWYGADAVENKRFYNIGAGKFRHPFWTNVDHFSAWYGPSQKNDIEHDLESSDPLPIENESAAIVYTSHTIEHINDQAAAKLFREAKRVLRKGGVFRATTPDVLLDYSAWQRNDRDYFYYCIEYGLRSDDIWKEMWKRNPSEFSITQMFISHVSSFRCQECKFATNGLSDNELMELFRGLPLRDALNSLSAGIDPKAHAENPHLHVNWWDADKLISMLKDAGFSDVYRSGYGQSRTPALRDIRFFDSTHPPISLYVEAAV